MRHSNRRTRVQRIQFSFAWLLEVFSVSKVEWYNLTQLPKDSQVMDVFMDRATLGSVASPWGTTFTSALDLGTNTITDGSMTGDWDYGSGDLTTTGDITTDGLSINSPATQTYKIGRGGDDNVLGITPITADRAYTGLRLYSYNGDAVETTFFEIYGKGSDADNVNREKLAIGWTPGGYYRIYTEKNGTGVARPLRLYSDTNSDQLVLNTDGSSTFGGDITQVDNLKHKFGTTDTDLQISSDGTNGIIDVATALRVGNFATGYTEVKGDGEINLRGTARVKRGKWLDFSGMKAPGTKPAKYVDHGISGAWEFSDGTDDTIVFNYKVPEDMDKTVASSFLIGWSSNTAVITESAVWQLEYLYTAPGEDTTANAQETLTVTSNVVAQANGLVVAEITGIDLPSSTDNCIHCRLKRLGADANDDLTDTAELSGVCWRYTSNKLGEAL